MAALLKNRLKISRMQTFLTSDSRNQEMLGTCQDTCDSSMSHLALFDNSLILFDSESDRFQPS